MPPDLHRTNPSPSPRAVIFRPSSAKTSNNSYPLGNPQSRALDNPTVASEYPAPRSESPAAKVPATTYLRLPTLSSAPSTSSLIKSTTPTFSLHSTSSSRSTSTRILCVASFTAGGRKLLHQSCHPSTTNKSVSPGLAPSPQASTATFQQALTRRCRSSRRRSRGDGSNAITFPRHPTCFAASNVYSP